MKITNKFNLPRPLVSAVEGYNFSYKKSHTRSTRFSVTQLIGPPKIRCLKNRWDHELTEDVSDCIWRVVGSAVHGLLEKHVTKDSLVEKRLYAKVDDILISGQADLYEVYPHERVLSDWKLTSVFSYTMGAKDEWEWQLNILNWLFSKQEYFKPADRLGNVLILRDWVRGKALSGDYPQTQVVELQYKPKPLDVVEKYIRERVQIHLAAEALADDDIPICTPEERWCRDESYAVKKVGTKRAINGGVCETLADAEAVLAKAQASKPKDKFEIERREKADIRCKGFCPVRQYCNYGKQYDENQMEGDSE